jgi:hypothetical protein
MHLAPQARPALLLQALRCRTGCLGAVTPPHAASRRPRRVNWHGYRRAFLDTGALAALEGCGLWKGGLAGQAGGWPRHRDGAGGLLQGVPGPHLKTALDGRGWWTVQSAGARPGVNAGSEGGNIYLVRNWGTSIRGGASGVSAGRRRWRLLEPGSALCCHSRPRGGGQRSGGSGGATRRVHACSQAALWHSLQVTFLRDTTHHASHPFQAGGLPAGRLATDTGQKRGALWATPPARGRGRR